MLRRSMRSGVIVMLAAFVAASLPAHAAGAAPNAMRVTATHVPEPGLGSVQLVTRAQQQAIMARRVSPRNTAPRIMPLYRGALGQSYYQRKAAAANNRFAPRSLRGFAGAQPAVTPIAGPDVDGIANSIITCPPGACAPPDQAIAASPTFVLQGVNASMAVYTPSGAMMGGYPIDFNAFLGGGPESVISKCNPNGPIMSDPRAFYDPNAKRFFVSIGQFDGAMFGDTCPNTSLDWIAVSATSNPTGAWHVYAFDTSLSGTELGDQPTLGFNKSVIAFNVNQFDFTTSNFFRCQLTYLDKAALIAGTVPASRTYTFSSGGKSLDTIQPVETETTAATDPGALYLTDTLNINFGGGFCSTGCNAQFVFGLTSPLTGAGGFTATVTTPTYALAPQADTPIGCTQCIETQDTRESAMPTYINTSSTTGTISWAVETGVNNATQTVPGALWGRDSVTKPSAGFAASLLDSGLINSATGDQAVSFPTTVQETGGSFFVLTDVMSSTLYNGAMFQVHRPADALGTLEAPVTLRSGVGPNFFPSVPPFGSILLGGGRWGDYEAASLDGTGSTAHVWLSAQYTSGGGDWATAFGRVR